MRLFSRAKLKRGERKRPKTVSLKPTATLVKTRTLTNILLGILISVIILGVLGIGGFADISLLVANIIVTVGTVFIMGYYLISLETHLFISFSRIFSFSLLSVLVFVLITLFQKLSWTLYALPITFITMIITVGYSRQLAIVNIFFQLFLIWVWEKPAFPILMTHFPATLIVALGLINIRTRAKIIRVGMLAGIALFVMVCVKNIFELRHLEITSLKTVWQAGFFKDALLGFGNGIISGFIMLGILPFLEKWFGVMTDLSLLELANLNQSILKRLSLEAPGTYHHSLRVGDLAEAAAETIGADTMLTRVGAYYHDIGKLAKPEYFVENETGESKHKDLSPTMSTLIITAHVKDGAEMARYERLPKRLYDFVSQHHGTAVVKYFYHEARLNAETSERLSGQATAEANNHNAANHANGSNPIRDPVRDNHVDETAFRYPGPKPQSKEVGIVLLADSVEATSRSLSNVTPGKLKNMVHEIVINRLLDGQLDQSSLTMWDLRKIEETFIRVLAGIFHARIQYPQENSIDSVADAK